MRKIIIIILIIAILPLSVMAHDDEGHNEAGPAGESSSGAGVLPGEMFYFVDLAGEWIDINLLTLSTRQKQVKLVQNTSERIVELKSVVDIEVSKPSAYKSARKAYEKDLRRAEDMAEKILVLDGAKIDLAMDLETKTRLQEQQLHSILENAPESVSVYVLEALNLARIENQNIFEFMVKNYQFNDEDIAKYRSIVQAHIDYVEEEISREDIEFTNQQRSDIAALLIDAREHLEAGLNIEAYQRVGKLKDILYSHLISN